MKAEMLSDMFEIDNVSRQPFQLKFQAFNCNEYHVASYFKTFFFVIWLKNCGKLLHVNLTKPKISFGHYEISY